MVDAVAELPLDPAAAVHPDQALAGIEVEDDRAVGQGDDAVQEDVPVGQRHAVAQDHAPRPDLGVADRPALDHGAVGLDQLGADLVVEEPGEQRQAGLGALARDRYALARLARPVELAGQSTSPRWFAQCRPRSRAVL